MNSGDFGAKNSKKCQESRQIHIFTFSPPVRGGRDSHFHVFTSGAGRAGFTFSRFHLRCGEGGIHIFTSGRGGIWKSALVLQAGCGPMSCFCVQGLGELASRRTCQLFLASACAGQAWVLCARACVSDSISAGAKTDAIMEAFAPGSTVIHSVSQKVHKVGDDRRLLCRARVAEQMLRALEAARTEDDLCQKCFRDLNEQVPQTESSSRETAATEPVQDEERAQEEEVDEEPAIASLFPKLPRGAANTSGYFLEEPGYEVSFEPVNCKKLEAVLELAIVRQQPVLFDEIAALRSRAVDIDSSGVGRIPVCHPSPSGPPCKGLAARSYSGVVLKPAEPTEPGKKRAKTEPVPWGVLPAMVRAELQRGIPIHLAGKSVAALSPTTRAVAQAGIAKHEVNMVGPEFTIGKAMFSHQKLGELPKQVLAFLISRSDTLAHTVTDRPCVKFVRMP